MGIYWRRSWSNLAIRSSVFLCRFFHKVVKWFLKTLIFLSVMEDGPYVRLSISKVFMWITTLCVPYVVIYHNDNLAAVIAAASSNLIATLNYHLRRQNFDKTGKLDDGDSRNWQEHYGPRNKFPDYSSRLGSSGKLDSDGAI